MKIKKTVAILLTAMTAVASSAILFTSCGGKFFTGDYGNYLYNNAVVPEFDGDGFTGEQYLEITENKFVSTEENAVSNISLDSSTYAYSNIRRMIKGGQEVYPDSVVIEQMLNYFNYSYENDTDEALSATLELGACPWNGGHYLASVAVKAHDYERKDTKNNFVFLIDVSGSMSYGNRLPLLQQSFRLLADELDEDDTVSIVTYASGVTTVADGVSGTEKTTLVDKIMELQASGSTNGSGGIQKAYELAEKHFIQGGNNRVFLATDGDFNVGISSTRKLENYIAQKRESGVYLSVFGYGMGNTRQDIMETLASKGNGNSYYIDSLLEAKKIFVSELGGTLNTVAKDAKCQIEFNPDYVAEYRLLGYENKMLTDEEFDDEQTDAGEIGAGHTTVAMYELVLNEEMPDEASDIFKTTLRYKVPETNESKEIVTTLASMPESVSSDFDFASCVVEFALLLRDSEYKGDATYEHLIEKLNTAELNDVYRQEFKQLVILASDRNKK